MTCKISSTVARIKMNLTAELRLGNLNARRDWGHAEDYVKARHLLLQQDEPDDYAVATGETHSVREFCELAFGEVGLDYRDFVKVDERFRRPAEVELLMADYTKSRRVFGWQPTRTFKELVGEMVQKDFEAAKNAATVMASA